MSKNTGFSVEFLGAIAKNEEELLQTINNISAEDVEKAVSLIDQATEILIFARGLTINVANELMKSFNSSINALVSMMIQNKSSITPSLLMKVNLLSRYLYQV